MPDPKPETTLLQQIANGEKDGIRIADKRLVEAFHQAGALVEPISRPGAKDDSCFVRVTVRTPSGGIDFKLYIGGTSRINDSFKKAACALLDGYPQQQPSSRRKRAAPCPGA